MPTRGIPSDMRLALLTCLARPRATRSEWPGDLGVLGAFGDPEELWSAFKTTVLDVAGGCLGTHRRANNNFDSQGTLDTIDQSRRAELFRELRRKTVRAFRVDKEVYVRGICEWVEHHL